MATPHQLMTPVTIPGSRLSSPDFVPSNIKPDQLGDEQAAETNDENQHNTIQEVNEEITLMENEVAVNAGPAVQNDDPMIPSQVQVSIPVINLPT